MTPEEQEKIRLLVRGLCMYATQVERMLQPEDYIRARDEVAKRGNDVIKVIQEVQVILSNL